MKTVRAGSVEFGGGALAYIGGPCAIESEAHALEHAAAIRDICKAAGVPFVYKSSYDKANRLSGGSFRGPGMKEGLRILARVKKEIGVPILTDIHEIDQAAPVAEVADIVQIPAFLSRQTDLTVAAAKTKRVVNIKKGQFLAPWDVGHLIDKVRGAGNDAVLVTERGASFGYNNLVADMRSLPAMRAFGAPVIFDAGHSVQLPGAAGGKSGGQREMIPVLARAATAAGCDGLFIEVHRDPDAAPSDGPNMIKLDALDALLRQCVKIHAAVR